MLSNIRDRFQYLRGRRAKPAQIQQCQLELLDESTLNSSYLILIIGSCAIATLGLLAIGCHFSVTFSIDASIRA